MKQGPVIILEQCGCKVDNGIPYRCSQHQLPKKSNKTFYVKYSGSMMIEAENEEMARKQIYESDLPYACATFNFNEVGKDVDELGWPINHDKSKDAVVTGPDIRD